MKKLRTYAKRFALPFVAVIAVLGGMAGIYSYKAEALSIWANTVTPTVTSESDNAAIEVGTKFRSSVATTVTGVKFYKGSGNTGTHTGSLWSSTGTRLATVTFTGETTTGWQTAAFATPVNIAANTTYVVSYFAPKGHYAVDEGYFANSAATNGTLTALKNGTDGNNGVYRYGSSSAFPNSSYNASNYWVDVVTATSDTVAPTVSLTAPASGASLTGTTTLSATATDNVAVSSVQFKVDGTNIGTADTTSPYSVSWDTTSIANGAHTLTAVATDSSGNSTTSASVAVTVTNQAPQAATSIWPNTAVPTTPTQSDTAAVELGLKFRSSVPTTVTGVKFYKGSGNTGTHTGSLWSSTGTRLATVTFTGETTTGWQTATFPTPVNITANTTYVISYFAPVGRYAADSNYFATARTNVNLTALANGTDGGNGVYRYGSTSGFPNGTYGSTNYWVDVVTGTQTTDPTPPTDTTPPTVTTVTPASSATGVATTTNLTATFSEAMAASTISSSSVTLKDAQGNAVAGTVAYDTAQNKVTLTPATDLEQNTVYAATVTTAVQDQAGNALASDYTWSFTTKATVAGGTDPLTQGHDGPVLIITKSGLPFTGYYSEILRAEGINSFNTVEIGGVNSALLARYDVVILGDMTLTASQVTTLTSWVNDGGNLIAMHPDKKLAGLLGLTDQSALLSDAYLKVNTVSGPGVGITNQTIQYHGVADKYVTSSDTAILATLYSNGTTATVNPAVTMRSVGTNGGQAVAFTYDLARSVVYTHQGNPSWSGQDRDGNGVIRPNDLFYGNMVGDVRSDYVDLTKVAIPQADEQQRLLANIITEVNKDRQPLPKFSYFPYNKKAVIVLAADDHANGRNSYTELNYQLNQSTPGCSVADWECVRSTSLIYADTNLTNAEALAFYNQGFDFGVHTSTGCNNWTVNSLSNALDNDIATFRAKYTSLPAQHVNRIHCIAWSDYVSAAKIEAQKGLRVDLNYYYWPGSWVQDRPGFMTGSGMTMRFADTDGTLIDTYQVPSHLVNESGQTFPQNINVMLDRALGAEGYYGVLGTHYDYSDSFDQQLVQSAKARNVPLVSGQQLLDWNDGRNNSYFTNSSWDGDTFTFTATVDAKLRQMGRVLLPLNSKNGIITTITRDGQSVSFATETMKGVTYAVFTASTGTYAVTYGQDTTPPTITSITPAAGATGVNVTSNIDVAMSEALDASTVTNDTVQLLDDSTPVAATVVYNAASNKITIDPSANLNPNKTYTVTMSTDIKDANGVALANPYTSSFTTGENAFSLWAPATQTVSSATDNNVELGLRFQSSQSGKITKILFYKSPTDTATTHTVTLWNASGSSLGTATSTNETASGWQTATFANPIAITSGTNYVASYRSPTGSYSYTAGGLAAAFTNGSLTALAGGGVFRYGGGFPDQSFGNTNYWVDVVFTP